MKYKKTVSKALLSAAVLGSLSFSYEAFAADNLVDAVKGGKVNGDFRLRYETNDTAGGTDEATALTLRSRLGYTTDDYMGFKAALEFEDVRALIDEYSPEDTTFDLVNDPEDTEVNQAYLAYTGVPATNIAAGRQRITLDNHRWVGNVGWRQDEQTFDALRIVNSSIANTTLTYAYLNGVHTIAGDAKDEIEGHLLNAGIDKLGPGKLTAYAYLLDYDTNTVQKTDSQTIGVRYAGAVDVGTKLRFAAEYAQQSDYGDAATFDGDYMLVEVGGDVGIVGLNFGYEVLGSDGGTAAVQTPLATGHAFNGWADKFLTTPAAGLVDMYLGASASVVGVNLSAVYHMYETDEGSNDLGDEINLLAAKKISDNLAAGLKLASFSADTGSGQVDTDKFWVWGELKF